MSHNDADQNQPVILHEMLIPMTDWVMRRQRFVAEHIVKNRLELRHDEDKEEGHDHIAMDMTMTG